METTYTSRMDRRALLWLVLSAAGAWAPIGLAVFLIYAFTDWL